jgi:hypothetical protein
MEIEFNTSRLSPAESGSSAIRRDATTAATDAVSFSTSDSLKSQIKDLSTVRPEKVAKAKELVSNGHYPPDYVLERISVLLALHGVGDVSNSSTSSSKE